MTVLLGTGLHRAHAGWLALTASTPEPTSSSIEIPPEDQTSPGLLGFLVTFAVAVAVIALGFALVRTLRRVDHRARVLAEQEAQVTTGEPAAGTAPGADAAGGSVDSTGSAGPSDAGAR